MNSGANSDVKIGPYKLTSPFLLAPMAGITDAPFRKLCRQFGAGMTTSEMTTADIGLWNTAKSRRRLDLDMDAEPRTVQIAGAEPQQLALAARLCVERGAQIIDINMGCPAKKVCQKAAGSALLRDPALVQQILEAVVGAVDVPVTLKIRTGWDTTSRNGPEIARIAEQSGIQALAVHGRTRACRFKGAAEYETIARIKDLVSIPVIANGDVTTAEKSLEVLRLSYADALMIGRGAQGRPWIFRELSHYHKTGETVAPLEINKVRDIMLDHLDSLYRFYGEKTGVRVARKHLKWYCVSLAGSDAFKAQVLRVDSAFDQLRLTREYFRHQEKQEPVAALSGNHPAAAMHNNNDLSGNFTTWSKKQQRENRI
ncbi:MAG: tRNA dihydrouridine synthase DusB [Gammaproteobacteria bacterium]|nr:tRNA dihydrouridine synthase DusB [Gammaproteobacteria bacterium]